MASTLIAEPVQAHRTTHPTGAGCPGCGSAQTRVFYELEGVPTNSCILWSTRQEALDCRKGDVSLRHCADCGFIFNAAFVPELTEYSDRYEETQGFSPTFGRFHTDLAAELIERHGLRGRDVMEIGCGKGEFLVLLAQLGGNRGIGIDPSAIPERLDGVEGAELVTLIPEYFDPRHCLEEPDFLCCKMTLEHIGKTGRFIETIRAGLSAGGETVVFFQVPDALRILRDCAFEDIYYEHCSYFTGASLRHLFRSAGFEVLRTRNHYDGQYLTIECRAAEAAEAEPEDGELALIAAFVADFAERTAALQERWRQIVQGARAHGQTVALWGSGSKAVSFLTTPGIGDAVDLVTDINPNRHNHFMPGTGHPIVAPAQLAQARPGLVVVMNRIYEAEIAADLRDMGISAEIACL